jgi:hypothetical protein
MGGRYGFIRPHRRSTPHLDEPHVLPTISLQRLLELLDPAAERPELAFQGGAHLRLGRIRFVGRMQTGDRELEPVEARPCGWRSWMIR